jgi:hypothetical protein
MERCQPGASLNLATGTELDTCLTPVWPWISSFNGSLFAPIVLENNHMPSDFGGRAFSQVDFFAAWVARNQLR